MHVHGMCWAMLTKLNQTIMMSIMMNGFPIPLLNKFLTISSQIKPLMSINILPSPFKLGRQEYIQHENVIYKCDSSRFSES